jgi:predicted DNA-binding protein (UPF0251 family)
MQREMPVHGEVRKVQDAHQELLKMCEDELDAVRLCIQLSSHSHEYIGKKLAIDKGHFSRMMQGSAGFPTHKRLALMEMCGSLAPVQYECMQLGKVAIDVAEYERLRAIEVRMASLETALNLGRAA